MYHLVEHGPIKWPNKEQHGFEISKEAQDLIEKLLTKDKTKRLGKDNDVKDVISHPWFASIKID